MPARPTRSSICQIERHGYTEKVGAIYSEFPRNPRSFVDVYRSFALRLDREALSEAYLEICTSTEAVRLERDLIIDDIRERYMMGSQPKKYLYGTGNIQVCSVSSPASFFLPSFLPSHIPRDVDIRDYH